MSHSLYWLLVQSLPGSVTPQNSSFDATNSIQLMKVSRYRRRLQALMRALYTISGKVRERTWCV